MRNSITRSTAPRTRKVWLLGSASALAMCAMVPSLGWATEGAIPETISNTLVDHVVTGYHTILAHPTNSDVSLSAMVTDDVGGIVGPGTSAITTANSFTASVGGNDVSNTISGTTLPLPNVSLPPIDGVAVLGHSENDGVTANARVGNSILAQELDASAIAATVSSNTMSAAVTLNQSITTVQGQVPVNYQADNGPPVTPPPVYNGAISSVDGSGGPAYNAIGSVLATTAQLNINSGQSNGSNAMVTENQIGETISNSGSLAVLNGSPAVTGNNMTANFIGNSATTALSISAGGAPSFNGSTAITNVQHNLTLDGAPLVPNDNSAATVKYSDIGIIVSSGSIALAGAAAVTGNTVTASAVGNQAAGTSMSGATGNILTLAGGIGLNGTSNAQNSETYFLNEYPHIDITADAVVNNFQDNKGTALDSIVKQNFITAVIPTIEGGSLAVSNNTITAQTVGNEAYNALLAPGLGSPGTGGALNGEFALGSMQTNQNSPLTATSYQSGVPVIVYGPIGGGSVTANLNTVSASATGNSVANTVDLNSSSLVSHTGTAAATYGERNPIGNSPPYTSDFGAYADVTLNSQQLNDSNSPVTATTLNGGTTLIGSFVGGVTGSTLSVTNNTTAALATGNAATNSLALDGALVQTSGALVNAQGNYSAVTAALIDSINGIATIGAENSTLTLTGNLQRAIATGNSASNTLSVTGSSISVANAGNPASVFHYVPSLDFPIASDGDNGNQTSAGFVAHNDQVTNAPVAAAVTFHNQGTLSLILPSMGIFALDGLAASTADNSMNAIVAAARGNQATTQVALAPTASLNLYEGDYSPFAVVANVQTLADGASVSASINSDAISGGPGVTPLPPIFTAVGGGMIGSTITLGGNQIATLAQGNTAINGLTLASTGTVIEPASAGLQGLSVPILSLVDPLSPESPSNPLQATLTANAAFVVHNLQYAETGSVSATQDATGVQAAVAGNISGSTVMIGGATAPLGNLISSTATTNLATNTLTLGASNLSATGGLVNFQVSQGATTASMGEPGTIPTPGTSHVVQAVTTDSVNGNNTDYGTFTGVQGTYTYAGWLVSTDPASLADGFTQGTTGYTQYYYKHVGGGGSEAPAISVVNSTDFPSGTYGYTQTYTNTTPGTPGTWGSPGFVINLNGNVTNSVLGISQNTVNATSTANSANNTLTATSAISSSALAFTGLTPPSASSSVVSGAVVLADVGLLNNQTLGITTGNTGTSTATANGSFWISNSATDPTPTYTNTTLSISDNTQQASALGNSATNSLTLSPGITAVETTPLTASILSTQAVTSTAEVPVSASSNMLISAPMALTGSTLTIARNTNTANAVANDVTNTLTVNGTTSLPGYNPGSQIGTAQNTLSGISASADYTVVNAQVIAGGSVTSTATTTVLNNDLYLDPATISNTTVTVDSNTTVAQALGNRASNTLTITAAGPSGATGSVANGQLNNASIGATATINTTLAIGQLPGSQTGSTSTNATYNMTNNATQALATGNQASNVLNASPTAYGTAVNPSGSSILDGVPTAKATYTVLNSQYNTGPVTALVSGVSPPLLSSTINTGQGGYVVALNTAGSGTVVNMSGNTVTSQAIGNRAANNIVLAALNTGTASSAINSVQQNNGAISATITNTQVGAAVSPGTVGRVANNQLAANAFGNVVTNSIITH